MNRDQLFRRVKSIVNPDIAREETFSFFGVGSGGARDAEETARFGVGQIILVDRPGETLEEHNIIRHTLGYRDLGRPKVEAVRDHILNTFPECVVETVEMDVTGDRDRLAQIVARSTQVHVCLDNERGKHAVNEAAVKAGATAIFAGVFDGGCGGEVARVVPGGACYGCIASHLNRSARPEKHETFDYAAPDSEQKSTAALNLDIAQIALIQARVGLLTMVARHNPAQDFRGNYVLFGNRPVEGLFPRMLSSEIWTIPKDHGCMICGRTGMSDDEIDAAADEILRSTLTRAS
jgi:molybdopterin/thiamine biosynthesis adenylyltransferase